MKKTKNAYGLGYDVEAGFVVPKKKKKKKAKLNEYGINVDKYR